MCFNGCNIKHLQCLCCTAIKTHDDMSEPLSRKNIIAMIMTAGGGKLDAVQAERTWDRTIFPLGRSLGLLTGYVRPQEGTSKRTAADAVKHQTAWYNTVTDVIDRVKQRLHEELNDPVKERLMLPHCIINGDEEQLRTYGSHEPVVGSADKTKHDNQNASSKFVGKFFLLLL